jgi:THUMP domain-like/Methyltransferase small domain
MQTQDLLNLMSPEGQSLLAELSGLSDKTDALKVVTKLRKSGHSPDLIAAALSQTKLRRKAKAKFGEFAENMFFSQMGLEQASRLQVAAIHAGRFRAAGINNVADLGCGIGAEAMAMASLDIDVTAVELDATTAMIASYNLAGFDNVVVENADVTKMDLEKFQGLFLDPARRDTHARKFDPETFQPNFSWVINTAKTKPAIVKLGPGLPHELIPDEAEAVWVSCDGELVELGLYFGSVRRKDVSRAALLITTTGKYELTSNSKTEMIAEIKQIGEYLYEPDNALIRSHLIGELTQELNLHAVSPKIAYLSSNELINSPWLKAYKIIDNLSFDRKKIKAYLKERGIGILDIKKRGADITPEQLRKELNPKGSNAATLIITRVNDQHRALVVEPIN